MRVLLLANTTGYQARAFADAARALGWELVLGTDRCGRLDDPWQDAAIPLHFENPAQAARILIADAGQRPVDVIVAVGDRPPLTAALVAERLGIAWHSSRGAAACHNKALARQVCADAGLATPRFHSYRAGEDALAAASEAPYPCVIKPASLSGSRGVIRADDPAQFRTAFERVAALLASRELQARKDAERELIVVEEYIPGREFAVEALTQSGGLRLLAVFDKPDPLIGPFFEETIYVTPARVEPEGLRQIEECVRRGADILGLRHGPLHAEVRLNDRGAWLLEVAARPIGGLCSRSLRFTAGAGALGLLSLEELILRAAAGEDLNAFEREPSASGVMMIPVPESGLFERVENLAEARAQPGVDDIEITVKPGQKLARWPEGASYPGFIFARAATPDAVEAALRNAHQRLRFHISPLLPVM